MPITHDAIYTWGRLTNHIQVANLVILNGKTYKDRWFIEEWQNTGLSVYTQCTVKWYESIKVLKIDTVPKKESFVNADVFEKILTSNNFEYIFCGKVRP